MAATRRPLVAVVSLSAGLVTLAIHLSLVPRYFPDDVFMLALSLVAGWVAFALVCYGAGRLGETPTQFPSMRLADVGAALFLVSVLLALALESFGFPPEEILEAYALPVVGVYVGLAMLGWSIGRRTEAINELYGEGR